MRHLKNGRNYNGRNYKIPLLDDSSNQHGICVNSALHLQFHVQSATSYSGKLIIIFKISLLKMVNVFIISNVLFQDNQTKFCEA